MKIEEYLKQLKIPYTNIATYEEAFTHPSYRNEKDIGKDYERLEFFGDAVLQYHVSAFIFDLYPDLPEGQLTTIRSKLVREESLARFARELGFAKLIKLGTGEEHSGGRDRNSILADIFEAFIGAICHDCNDQVVENILHQTIYKHVDDIEYDDITDYKTKLQEVVQADERKTVSYHVVESSGPSNAPTFKIVVKMDEMILGTGAGGSKKKAEQQAAKDALNKMAK